MGRNSALTWLVVSFNPGNATCKTKLLTPAKRKFLRWENIPQSVAAVIYMCFEGGSWPVVLLNVALPVAQIFLGLYLYKRLQRAVVPLIGEQLLKAAQDSNQMRLSQRNG